MRLITLVALPEVVQAKTTLNRLSAIVLDACDDHGLLSHALYGLPCWRSQLWMRSSVLNSRGRSLAALVCTLVVNRVAGEVAGVWPDCHGPMPYRTFVQDSVCGCLLPDRTLDIVGRTQMIEEAMPLEIELRASEKIEGELGLFTTRSFRQGEIIYSAPLFRMAEFATYPDKYPSDAHDLTIEMETRCCGKHSTSCHIGDGCDYLFQCRAWAWSAFDSFVNHAQQHNAEYGNVTLEWNCADGGKTEPSAATVTLMASHVLGPGEELTVDYNEIGYNYDNDWLMD